MGHRTLMVGRVQQAPMGHPNSRDEKSSTAIYGSTKLSWWEQFNRHLWVNRTLMVRRVQQATIGHPNSHGEKFQQAFMGQPNSYCEKSSTGIYGSNKLPWLEEFNMHIWVNRTLMVRRVQQASMGQPKSHDAKSSTGIYGLAELPWWQESNRLLWVNRTLLVRRVQQASMGQPNSHGEKSSTGTILINISLWIDCLFEIRKIAVCFLWLSLPSHYRVTDEALLAETTSSFLWMFSLLLKEHIFESMGQPNSYGEKSITGNYWSTELSWWVESYRHLWVNRTPMVRTVHQASMCQRNCHGEKSLTGIYG